MLRVDLGGVGSGGQWTTVNLDTSGYRAAPDIVADITARADELANYFAPGEIDALRCIHTLEHLPAYEILPTLKMWRSLLKPGSELLIVVPDLGTLALDYADNRIPMDVFAAVAYVSGFRTIQGPHEEHRFGWDMDSLTRLLCEAGFVNVREAGDEHWEASWLLDFPDLIHTGLVGRYRVPNLRVVGEAS